MQTSAAVALSVDRVVGACPPETAGLSTLSDATLKVLLQRVLWYSRKPNAKPWSNIEEASPLLKTVSRDYLPTVSHFIVDNSGEESMFRSVPPRNTPDYITPLF